MKKYREALLANIKQHLESWFDQSSLVSNNDVYIFLHSLAGTSGTIGLTQLSDTARRLMLQLEDLKYEHWQSDQLRSFLLELVMIGYEYQDDQEMLLNEQEAVDHDSLGQQPLVLILDDDAALLMYLKEQLEQRGWSVIATAHAQKAIHYFHDMHPDCLILDLHIPGENGFQIYETLKEKMKTLYIPTTIISIDCEKQTRLQAYEMGADDMMCKPLDIDELAVRLNRQHRRKQWLDQLMFVDELTGAYNRKYLEDSYARACSEAERMEENFSLAIMDLDYFKNVNDTYGHLAGDQVLTRFSSFIKSHIRSTDVLIRYGGEEFILLLQRTDKEQGKAILERFIKEFTKFKYDFAADSRFSISFSAGITEVNEFDKPLQHWVEAADAALYNAKKRGRSRVEIMSEAMPMMIRKRLKIAIIDDDAMIRTMLTEHIKEGFAERFEVDIRSFRDGQLFFEDKWHAGKGPYLVVLDVMMPGMDGLEVLQKIRHLPNCSSFTIIMLTGKKDEEDIVKALQLGADDYMTKPFSLRELEARMFRLVHQMI